MNDLPIAVAPSWLIELVKEQPHTRNEGSEPEADAGMIAAALAGIPNDDVSWTDWNRMGMATWRAAGGSTEGFIAWDGWSKKSDKYNPRNTMKKWDGYFSSPPDSIGAGTIFYEADQADPWWRERYAAQVEAELKAAGPGSEADRRMSEELGIDFSEQQQAEEQEAEEPPAEDAEQPSATRAEGATGRRQLLLSSAEFVKGFVPPDYLIDGLLQRKNVYALTGRTGDGKTAVAIRLMAHVARGLPLAGRSVEQGRVLFFAGENPDDVRSRWIKLCEEMKLDPADLDVFFMSGAYPISNDQIRGMIEADVAVAGAVTLLIVDTSAAFYSGSDENDNVQLGAHARMLRSFVKLNGDPTILVTCHPTKNPDMSNLLPRGGGAFLAEIDGNLVAIREHGSTLVEITTHGKFRGAEFEPFAFKLVQCTSEKLKDSKGRLMWTVFAEPVSEGEREAMENAGEKKRDQLLFTMKDRPAASIAELATAMGWTYKNGDPNRSLVHRLLKSLQGDKLVEKKGRRYVITSKGKKALDEAAAEPM
jgi:hypothetical protein